MTNRVPVILQELHFVVNGTGHYLSFINLDNMHRILYSDQTATRLHPGFIWAVLALANLMRSSTYGHGQPGLANAMALFAEAKSALDIAWADPSYAYGALIIALFESSAHPHYTHARALNALVELDDYIHQMRLTMHDVSQPDATQYDGVPVIYYPSDRETLNASKGCGCLSSHSSTHGSSHHHTSSGGPGSVDLGYGGGVGGPGGMGGRGGSYNPPWDAQWTLDQIRAEEVRRLCWSALSLVSAFLAQAATDNRRMPSFHLSDPRQVRTTPLSLFVRRGVNLRLLASLVPTPLPRGSPRPTRPRLLLPGRLTAKESVWALYCRSMLLWNYANRFRGLEGPEDEGVSEEVTEVMSEAQVIDESLDMHKCGLDGMLMFTTREYTHNLSFVPTPCRPRSSRRRHFDTLTSFSRLTNPSLTPTLSLHSIRMLVTQALRILQGYDRGVRSPGPYFKRQHLEDWCRHQEKIVRQVLVVCQNLGGPEGVQVTERPFRVQWFFNGLATALQLWEYDRTLDEALHLGKKFLQIVDTMNYLWDCPENRGDAAQLRSRLTEACRMSGVEPPYSPRQMSMR
ncbi:hypothetical protein NMY22_g13832 [Coprinellus aureogranulatus]|nr:hypothetical protein NMY22_g13832 [Coprinellus aureogranulatus]